MIATRLTCEVIHFQVYNVAIRPVSLVCIIVIVYEKEELHAT